MNSIDSPSAFAEDRSGNLWIGLYRGGLLRRRNGQFEILARSYISGMGLIDELHLDEVGHMWIATSLAGLIRVDDPVADHPQLRRYGTPEGLSSNEIHCITEDRWGNLYVGTGRGVDRLNPISGLIKHYSAKDGLAKGTQNIAYRRSDGTLWFGTLHGLSELKPLPDAPASPPRILISGIEIAGVPLPISDLGQLDVPTLHLAPGKDDVQIEFVGLEYGAGETLRYQYLLEGAAREWSQPTEQRTVNFANLAPGSYRFLVKAQNSEGSLSLRPATFSFTIPPPLWKRWWVLISLGLAAGAGAAAVHRVRVARLLELERMRTRIATDLHDDVGSSLSQIAVLSEVTQRQRAGEGAEAASEALSRIAAVSRELIDSMSDIVWAINPRRDHLSELTSRMRRFASDVFASRDIRFTFQAPEPKEDLDVGADFRRQVFLIFKESVNNSVRHSRCSEVSIRFERLGSEVILNVRDNGIGFDLSQPRDGHGLDSLKVRAKSLGGDFEVSTSPGTGSIVSLRVPLEGRRSRWRIGKSPPE